MKNLILISLILVNCALAHSAGKKIAAPVKVKTSKAVVAAVKSPSENFNLKVTSGHKVSTFEVVKEKKGGTLRFSNNEGEIKNQPLSEKDMKYLMGEVAKLKKSNDKSLCDSRSMMELHQGAKTTFGCIGSPTDTAKRMLNMANLFSGIVRL